jgi:GDP-L-fucose synthase
LASCVGYDITIRELAEGIANAVGVHGGLQFDATKADGAPQKLMDSSRLLAMHWRPTTTLQQGLEMTYAWYVEHVANRKVS